MPGRKNMPGRTGTGKVERKEKAGKTREAEEKREAEGTGLADPRPVIQDPGTYSGPGVKKHQIPAPQIWAVGTKKLECRMEQDCQMELDSQNENDFEFRRRYQRIKVKSSRGLAEILSK